MATNSPNSPLVSEENSASAPGKRIRNLLIVMAGVLLTVSLFFGTRTQTDTATLTKLAEKFHANGGSP